MTPDERQAARKKFLDQIVDTLKADERFVAAYLTGSLGSHGWGDAYSDIDIMVIVDTPYADVLWSRPWIMAGKTTDERLAIFKQFGQPAIIHENHNNALDGGTFTSVTFAESAFTVDWTFVSEDRATLPEYCERLFNKRETPFYGRYSTPIMKEDRAQIASEKVAFFWMMTTVTIKYMLRRDVVKFHTLLAVLHRTFTDVSHLLTDFKPPFDGKSLVYLALTYENQKAVVRDIARQMVELMPGVVKLGGYVPDNPMNVVEALFALTPVHEQPFANNFVEDRDKVKQLIYGMENYVAKRLGMYIGEPTPDNLLLFLSGIHSAMYVLLSPRNEGREYQREVFAKRGWRLSGAHPYREMQERGMDNDEILQEMIAIEIEMWKCTYDID